MSLNCRFPISLIFFCYLIVLGEASRNTSDGHGAEEGHGDIVAAKWEWYEFSVHITIMLFLLIVILIKMAFRRIPYLADYIPESLLLITVGIIFGSIVKFGIRQGSFEGTVWSLTPTLFFTYLLPPIVLESAYSLYNRTFSEYLGVVLIFAVLGTIFNFLIIGFAMYGVYKIGGFGYPLIDFDVKGFLLFSSLIVAVDPVAVLAIFQDIGVELSLYYIVFGESLLNDAITVVLYDIMAAFAGSEEVTGHQIGVGIASFFTVSFGGLLIGVVVGIVSCVITRIKSHLSAFVVILLAYFSYIMTDCVGWSGIIAMIGCGLVQAAYAFHNLDHDSVCMVHKLCKLVSEISESVIFLFLGLEVLTEQLEWQTGFMLWSLVFCLIARAVVVLGVTLILNAVHVDGRKISFTEQTILIYGGLRGAVAFSLAILISDNKLGPQGEYNRRLIITATLFIILFTVGFMGMTMKPLVRLLKIRMQAKQTLSLMSSLNTNMLDETMTAIEVISGAKGRNRVRDWIIRMDERYVRHWLQREPETHDQKLIKVYEKIALKLHYATIRPNRTASLLDDIPEALKSTYLMGSQAAESFGKILVNVTEDSVEEIKPRRRRSSAYDAESAILPSDSDVLMSMLSSRRATLLPHDKRQAPFEDTLQVAIRKRTRALSNCMCEVPLPRIAMQDGGHTNKAYTPDVEVVSEHFNKLDSGLRRHLST
ncbi:Sodium/hydrogen exchanger [Fasciolopsis buskii]|uniref:Sodium/hydrogen exchanger n=1 Tax=Fasciolopsis buskii TaxID=27845 RepID=A0A8E0VEI6_9TREM|nr:Sodium/hydrogen exchanger [Fasciolopsis buski]